MSRKGSLFLDLDDYNEGDLDNESYGSDVGEMFGEENYLIYTAKESVDDLFISNKKSKVVSLKPEKVIEDYAKLLNEILKPRILGLSVSSENTHEAFKALRRNKTAKQLTFFENLLQISCSKESSANFKVRKYFFLSLFSLDALRCISLVDIKFDADICASFRKFINLQNNIVFNLHDSENNKEVGVSLIGIDLVNVVMFDAEELGIKSSEFYIMMAKEILRAESKQRRDKLPLIFSLDPDFKLKTKAEKYFYSVLCKVKKCCINDHQDIITDFPLCVPLVLGMKGRHEVLHFFTNQAKY